MDTPASARQVLINAVLGELHFAREQVSGNATNQASEIQSINTSAFVGTKTTVSAGTPRTCIEPGETISNIDRANRSSNGICRIPARENRRESAPPRGWR